MSWLRSLIDGNEREVARLRRNIDSINVLEPEFEQLSNEQLRAKTDEFRERLEPHVKKVDEAREQRAAAKEPADQEYADAEVKSAYSSLNEALTEILPEAFAVVREASKRTIGLRHFDVQMIGGQVLNQGRIAEMATGEGKTLVASLPLYLNSLAGKGAHLVTVNDYLAKRDVVTWNGPIFHLLGLSVGVIQSFPYGAAYLYEPGYVSDDVHMNDMQPVHRRDCYMADIVYGTNAEFGFDYLRDNMAHSMDELVQRDLHYAIVDEVDSILVDEARTPLIISGMPEESGDLYYRVDRVVARLQHERDYTVDEKVKTGMLTDDGVGHVEEGLGVSNLADDVALMHHVQAALKARYVYKRDVDYVVKDGQVIIVDEFTGRLMHGRRYSDGLHQAIEAKEGVKIEEETQTVATITLQNYFRLYKKLAGMTGTAKTEENEFRKIYAMDVVVAPTNVPCIRKDQSDVIYKTEEAKYRGIVLEILQKYAVGQPVLVGTRSIEVSERLSERLMNERLQLQALIVLLRNKLESSKSISKDEMGEHQALLNTPLDDLQISKLGPAARALDLRLDALEEPNFGELQALLGLEGRGEVLRQALEEGIPHAVLNAKYHEKEAEIISDAGKKGAVTIATNMAGRGVDIILGGKPPEGFKGKTEESDDVRAVGGLAIIGSERHESRRIDRQLRGRSGRQGDPGESRFYLSLEDELWRLFGDRGRWALAGWPEHEPLAAKLLTAAIERAQKKVEEHNFGIRKHTLEYDDVMNVQRDVIYRQRREILEGADLRDTILGHAEDMVAEMVAQHASPEIQDDEWDLQKLYEEIDVLLDVRELVRPADLSEKSSEELTDLLVEAAERRYQEKEVDFEQAGADLREAERAVTLKLIDDKWVEHLNAMDYLREGIYLRGYAQQDPLVAYKKEAYQMFQALLKSIQDDMVSWMFHLVVRPVRPQPVRRRIFTPVGEDGDLMPMAGGLDGLDGTDRKTGRNAPCPCGSGKKYKRCHGARASA
jgi:preprotein translocase subunit SecA